MSWGFWAAYREAEETTRRNAVNGAVEMAQQFREANRHPPEHVVRTEFPRWIFNILTEDDRLKLANEHHIHAVPRGGDDAE